MLNLHVQKTQSKLRQIRKMKYLTKLIFIHTKGSQKSLRTWLSKEDKRYKKQLKEKRYVY